MVYREGVTRDQMIKDSWARGLLFGQVKDELLSHGHVITEDEYIAECKDLDSRLDGFFNL